MPFSDWISRLICIYRCRFLIASVDWYVYREGISLPHNFHENYATCSGNTMSKSIKLHLPLSWLARFVSANIPFFKRRHFSRKFSSDTINPMNFTSYLQFLISNQRKSTMDDNSNMAPNPVSWNKSSECYCSQDKERELHLTVE
jgi:hypothetical protein